MAELCRIKNRIHKRKSLQLKRNRTKENEDERKTQDENFREPSVESIPLVKVEEFVDMAEIDESDQDESSMDIKTYAEPGSVYIQETHEQNTDEVYDDVEDFSPISNDEELETVSRKIKTNPEYLKQLVRT